MVVGLELGRPGAPQDVRQQCDRDQHHRDDHRRNHRTASVEYYVEDQQHRAGEDDPDADQGDPEQHMGDLDHGLLGVLAEQHAVQVDRRQPQRGGQHRGEDQAQIDRLLELVQLRETVLERDGQQETGDDLGAGLGDPELLEHLVPVAVHPLVERLVATVRRVDIGLARVTVTGAYGHLHSFSRRRPRSGSAGPPARPRTPPHTRPAGA